MPKWRNGSRKGLKIPREKSRVSSNLTLGTIWRVGRAVDGTCLENKSTGMYLGFESLTLRQLKDNTHLAQQE